MRVRFANPGPDSTGDRDAIADSGSLQTALVAPLNQFESGAGRPIEPRTPRMSAARIGFEGSRGRILIDDMQTAWKARHDKE
jgi:hypothetical protein